MRLIPGLVILALLVGCTTGAGMGSMADRDVYTGAGNGTSLAAAINAAKMDAVKKAVVDLIGEESERANHEKLVQVLYSTRNPNAFVFNETLETLREDGSLLEGDLYYELRIRVNVEAVQRTLEANSISRSSVPVRSLPERQGSASGAGSDSGEETTEEAFPVLPAEWGSISSSEERFIRRYVETMTYMVYFNEQSQAATDFDSFIMKSAVNQANSYLVSDGRVVVDAAQVERLKQDQRLVYEEETGREISLLQWVARRLNADVYIELDAKLSTSGSKGDYYGSADVTLNMYETSTGQIIGSVNRRSQNSYSRTSADNALINAVQSTVYQAMPRVVEMARQQMTALLTRGVRFELTIQNQPDARTMSRFRSALADEAREVATISQSPEEILYEVFYIGSTDDLVDLVFEVSERVAGLEDMTLIISRGRSLTFDAGY